jgi:CRP-like cAMP-binding protein
VTDKDQSERKLVGVRVLEVQPELAEGLDDEQAALARRHVVAVLDSVEPGPWRPADAYRRTPGALGLLIVDGMVARDLRIAGRWCSELLGPGDLLRPWDYEDDGGASVQSDSSWTVLEPVRVAVLDERFARVACKWPQLVAGIVSRTLRRSRWMAILLAISNLTRVDERVTALMWHLADRWGHVTPEGVVVPVPLTHDMIGRLVGAHRPSVTSALGDLGRSSVLTRRENGWLLHGEPPERLTANRNGHRNGEARPKLAGVIDPTLMASLPALAANALF